MAGESRRVASRLFGQGASVAFGHDWREDGVMEAVHGFALQTQPPIPLSPESAEAPRLEPLLLNVLPWPDAAPFGSWNKNSSVRLLKWNLQVCLQELLAIRCRRARCGIELPAVRYLHARGLTFLRHRLNDVCQVRLCVGGRRSGSQGRYPGIIEEALLAVQQNKPLYLASIWEEQASRSRKLSKGKTCLAISVGQILIERLYQRAASERNQRRHA